MNKIVTTILVLFLVLFFCALILLPSPDLELKVRHIIICSLALTAVCVSISVIFAFKDLDSLESGN